MTQGFIGAVFDRAWRAFTSRYRMLLVPTLVVFAASLPALAPSILQYTVPGMNPTPESMRDPEAMGQFWRSFGLLMGISCCALIYEILFLFPLCSGAALVGVAAAQGRDTAKGLLMCGFGRYGRTVLSYVVVGAIMVGVTIVVGIVAACAGMPGAIAGARQAASSGVPGTAEVSGGVLAIMIAAYAIGGIASLWIFVRLGPVFVRVADPDREPIGIGEGLTEARRLTKGFTLPLAAIAVLGSVAVGLTVLVLGVGIIFLGYPLMWALIGATYAELYERNPPVRDVIPTSDDPFPPRAP